MTSKVQRFIERHSPAVTPEEPKTFGEQRFTFGRYKGVSYDEVFECHPEYVVWILNKADPKYCSKIQAYYTQRIEALEED
jgi:hypothetical protein